MEIFRSSQFQKLNENMDKCDSTAHSVVTEDSKMEDR